MSCKHIPFTALSWKPGAHPLERKKGPEGNLVVLEFAPGFEDANWCRRSHILYVVAGAIELVLEDGVARAACGEALVVSAGTAHRARNPGPEPAVLFVVSDL